MKADRAKIFAPFAALDGHGEILREKEKIKVEKKILSDERKSEIDLVLRSLRRGTPVFVEYYSGEGYSTLCGAVEKMTGTFLTVDGKTVGFDDIYDVTAYPV